MKTLAQGIAVVAFFAVTVRFERKSMEFLDNNDNSGARSTLFERGALRSVAFYVREHGSLKSRCMMENKVT